MNVDKLYQEKIRSMLDERSATGNGKTSRSLLAELGCRCMISGDKTRWQLSTPSETSPLHEVFAQQILLRLFTEDVLTDADGDEWRMGLLDGMLQNDRWRQCLETEGGAYALVVTLRKYFRLTTPGLIGETYRMALQGGLSQDVGHLLHAWLGTQEIATPPISVNTFTRSVFGDIWCDLCIDHKGEILDHQTFDRSQQMILTMRPDFAPGLLPSTLDRIAVPLPGLNLV